MPDPLEPCYALGLDYGTNSARCLIVRTSDGAEVGDAENAYAHGENGVVLSDSEPELARQHPADYLDSLERAVKAALEQAFRHDSEFNASRIRGIGVDTTASTPIPVDAEGLPLALQQGFRSNPNAMAWLWKDHTSKEEAAQITAAAQSIHPEYLAKCGGTYSSEWFWSKIFRCAKVDPQVSAAARSWMELADWIPNALAGAAGQPKRGICSAGHKGLFHRQWGGYPDVAFLRPLHPELARIRESLDDSRVAPFNQSAGELTSEWAERLGVPEGAAVAVGTIDAHAGAVGSGIRPGTLVKILGTSTCDIMAAPLDQSLPDIPGLCGMVPESVLPGHYGLEAGQSAVGDIFNWWIQQFQSGERSLHDVFTREALALKPGQSGLLALDWNNGNRTVLVDPKLTGLLIGQTLRTRPAEIYRALIEATAFGARVIIDRLEDYGVRIDQVIACGGIAEKSKLVMQIYADVLNRPMHVSRSAQACALGAAIAGAVAGGVFETVEQAQASMTGVRSDHYKPDPGAVLVYDRLYRLYKNLHDSFGVSNHSASLSHVMKELLAIRDGVLDIA